MESLQPLLWVLHFFGKEVFSLGVKQVDDSIVPEFTASAVEDVSPHVLLSYAILFWFSQQVCKHNYSVSMYQTH